MLRHCLLILFSLAGICACQSSQQLSLSPQSYIHDQGYPGYQQHSIETPEDIFALDQPVIDYLERHILPIDDKARRLRYLIKHLFNPEKVNLLYASDANTVASETFNQHTANCLSMSILAYSMAEYAGFTPQLQDVNIPEFWDLRQGYSFINGHVNLRVMINEEDRGKLIDFNDTFASSRFAKTDVDKSLATAMFYNNKGAMAMIEQNLSLAYRYFREALLQAPNYIPTLSNLGVLYRISGYSDWAEDIYKAALTIEHDSLNVLDNLAVLYDMSKRQKEASAIRSRIERRRLDNPYYHYYLGELAYNNRHWQQAVTHYRQAIRMGENDHQFYFGLARAYSQLGKFQESRKNLRLAKRHSDTYDQYSRYEHKLALMH